MGNQHFNTANDLTSAANGIVPVANGGTGSNGASGGSYAIPSTTTYKITVAAGDLELKSLTAGGNIILTPGSGGGVTFTGILTLGGGIALSGQTITGTITMVGASTITTTTGALTITSGNASPPLFPVGISLTSVSAGFAKIGNVTTQGGALGMGVPAIFGYGDSAAQTAAISSIATYTCGASDTTFEVSANVQVTVSTAHSFSVNVNYTDETNTARVLVLPIAQLAGSFVASGLITQVTGTGAYESAVMTIRCKAGTAITIQTPAGGTYTTVTYNARGIIKLIG